MPDRFVISDANAKRTSKRELLYLLAQLVDPEPCNYDHHANCQTHSLDPMPCPHERAKRLLI